MSARPAKQRQTKTGKSGRCLPYQQSKGRQKQENHQNVCSINNAMADRLQIY
jgi:hypothetical protein